MCLNPLDFDSANLVDRCTNTERERKTTSSTVGSISVSLGVPNMMTTDYDAAESGRAHLQPANLAVLV